MAGLRTSWAQCNHYETILGQVPTPSSELDQVELDLGHRLELWETATLWRSSCQGWIKTHLRLVDLAVISHQVTDLWSLANEAQKALPSNPVFEELRCQFRLMQDMTPAIAALQNPHLRSRHWQALSGILGTTLEPEKLMLGIVTELNIVASVSEIQSVSMTATQEHFVQVALEGLDEIWTGAEFTLTSQGENHDEVIVLGPLDHIYAQVDDCLATVSSALASRFAQAHLDAAKEWQVRLLAMQDLLEELASLQKRWTHLDSILSAMDVQKQLASEFAAFQVVDASWKQTLLDLQACPSVNETAANPTILEGLKQNSAMMETIEIDLRDYLETKRMAFP
ncbi:unnamed protein product, partial [Polarella glacialis]